MKKRVVLITTIMIFGMLNFVQAADVKYTLGIRSECIYSEFSLINENSPIKDIKDISGIALILGPAIHVTIDEKFFVELSYLVNLIPYEHTSSKSIFISNHQFNYQYVTEIDQTDLNLKVGYKFHDRVSGFIGYQMVNLDFDQKISLLTDDSDLVTLNASFSGLLTGPEFGMFGNYPIQGTRIVLFGSLAYQMLTLEMDPITYEPDIFNWLPVSIADGDLTGFIYEFGVGYGFDGKPASVSLSFKRQENDGNDAEVTFSVLRFDFNWTF